MFGSILSVLSGVSLSFLANGSEADAASRVKKLCGCLMSAQSEKMILETPVDVESQRDGEASNVRKSGRGRRNREKKKRNTKNDKERAADGEGTVQALPPLFPDTVFKHF